MLSLASISYSKTGSAGNLRCKYAIYKLNQYYSSKELFDDDGSIEHLIPEKDREEALNIGNLILLELSLNNEAGSRCYQDKIEYYNRSNYKWIHQFVSQHPTWDKEQINKRAVEMSKTYYYSILGRHNPD